MKYPQKVVCKDKKNRKINEVIEFLIQLRGIPQSRFDHITGLVNPGSAVTLGFPFQNEHGMLL
jgi:hypothetical protein